MIIHWAGSASGGQLELYKCVSSLLGGGHHEMKMMRKGGMVRLPTTTEEDEGHVQQRGKITPQTAALISGRLSPADYWANTHSPANHRMWRCNLRCPRPAAS